MMGCQSDHRAGPSFAPEAAGGQHRNKNSPVWEVGRQTEREGGDFGPGGQGRIIGGGTEQAGCVGMRVGAAPSAPPTFTQPIVPTRSTSPLSRSVCHPPPGCLSGVVRPPPPVQMMTPETSGTVSSLVGGVADLVQGACERKTWGRPLGASAD